jgi:hypothetical protein
MTFFLTTLPLWFSGLILIVPTTLLAMAGPVIVPSGLLFSVPKTCAPSR